MAFIALGNPGKGLTFALTIATFLVFYEWIHYLVHTDYKPRHAIYRGSGAITGITTSRTSGTGSL